MPAGPGPPADPRDAGPEAQAPADPHVALPAAPILLTVGHSNQPLEDFLQLLAIHGVNEIADVRRFPRSRRHPHFSLASLAPSLAAAGIACRHWPELGGFREARPDSPNVGLEGPIRGYADHMETREFAAALDRLLAAARVHPLAVMCAEALPAHCHRRLLSDAAVARGFRVEHILGRGPRSPHVLTPGLRIERGRLLYEGEVPRLPGL